MSDQRPIRNVRAEGKEATRKGLLEIASQLLEQEGANALSMRRIAKLAGCSTSVLYTQFGGKDGLASGLFEEGFERLETELKAVQADDPLEKVRLLNRTYRKVALENSTHYSVMFGRPIPEFTPSVKQLELAWQSIQPLISSLELCISKGILRGEPEKMAMKLWMLVHGLASVELSGYFPENEQLPKDMLERALDDFFKAWSS